MKQLEKAKNDIIMGAFCVLFGIAAFAGTFTFKLSAKSTTLSAAFVPRILACGMILLAAVVLVRGVLAYRRVPAEVIAEANRPEKRAEAREVTLRYIKIMAILLTSAIIYRYLGFILTMMFMEFSLFVVIEKKERRNYKLYAILAVTVPIVLFFVFYYGFSTLLPLGVLKGMLNFL